MSIAVQHRMDLPARVTRAIGDGMIAAQRNVVVVWRVPTVLVFELVQPIMFVVLFVYVFGGNIVNLPIGVTYVNFLMPGIIIQNAIFGSTTTAIGIADDLKKGMIDRFRSLPMARSAVLAGRTTADVMKNFILVILVIAVGYLVGFSFQNGLLGAIALVILTLAVGFAFSWISATVGLWLKDVEAVQAATFTWIFPVVFISSALVPVRGMAPAFQWIAEHNPVTYWANLARFFALGDKGLVGQTTDSAEALMVKSFIWFVLILAIFVPLSIRLYRKLN
ncbi:MAG: ABC transporter permease [Actinomycetota bacterium]